MTNFKTYFPFKSKEASNYNFTNINQGIYIFSEQLYISSGSIVIITIKENTIPITLIFYFDNLAAQITSVTLFKGTISMPIFTDFITKAKNAKLFKAVDNNNLYPSWLNLDKFILLLVPKNYNRDWIFRKLSDEGIILKSYLWKDESIPKVLKDLNKFFNREFRRNISLNSLVELVDKFNEQVKKKLRDLEDSSNNSSEPSLENNIDSSIKRGLINKPLLIHTSKRYYSTSAMRGSLKNISKRYLHIPNKQSFNTVDDYIRLPRKIVYNKFVYILSRGHIIALVNKLEDEIKSLFKDNPHFLENIKISTQFKVEFEDGTIRSISSVDTIDYKDFKFLEESYVYNWEHKYTQHYSSLRVEKIFISYKILPGEYKRKLVSYISENDYRKSFTPFKINAQIPKTMNIEEWGSVNINRITEQFEVWLAKSNMFAHIQRKTSFKNIISVFYKRIGRPIYFTDERESDDLTTFTRTFSNISYKFNRGVQVLFKQLFDKIEFIDILKPHKTPRFKFITMDLETKEKDGKLIPVCISIYIPNDSTKNSGGVDSIIKTFAIWDYSNPEEMITAAFKTLMRRKYRGYNIYFHNFSYFDSIFIIKILANLPDTQITPNFRDGKLLKLTIKYDLLNKTSSQQPKYNCSIHILDSLLILPSSLDKLGKAFSAEDSSAKKTIFPLKILNDEELSLDYNGSVPDLKYFHHPNNLNKNAYNAFINKYKAYKELFQDSKSWNLKRELIQYCEQDVKVLHYVITKFANEIYNKFKVNIFKYPTLPSIAFAIYRIHFMKNPVIPIIKGKIYNDIKNAYYGGFVDVYKPYSENVNSYDVNSLYPTSMWNCMMPIGKPTYIEGSEMSLSEIFGFVYVKVHAPDLNTPILPYKSNTPPFSTRYPTGSWEGWYFTEELLNAEKYGYKFKLIKGYHFEKAILFCEYVNNLYSIKQSVTPSDPWYMISKLLLNSLYGRFGMSPEVTNNIIINEDEVDEFNREDSIIIQDTKELGSKIWVQYIKKSSDEDEVSLNNISVPISAAIAAWSRIHMTHYIMKYSNNICYIDTDGIKVNCELSSQYVGNKLGQMKFEGNFTQAVFIAPKVYGGVNSNEMISKVKGLKDIISYWLLKTLLYIPDVKIRQFKWHRDFSNGVINIIDQIYTLSATENKRELVKDSLGAIISTRPYKINNGEDVVQEPFILFYFPKYLLFILVDYSLNKLSTLFKQVYPHDNIKISLLNPPYINLKYLLTSSFNLKYLLPLPIPDIYFIFKLPTFVDPQYGLNQLNNTWKLDSINLTGHLAIIEQAPNIIELPAPQFLLPPKIILLPAPDNYLK